MTGRELAHEPGSLPTLKGAYGNFAQPLSVFRFLSDPERKIPVFPPTLHAKFVYGGTETPSVDFVDSPLRRGPYGDSLRCFTRLRKTERRGCYR